MTKTVAELCSLPEIVKLLTFVKSIVAHISYVFLSEVECWELLQKKVFHNGITLPYLSEIGKHIAKRCKGLPLAVTLIAGLLARTEKTLRRWNEVAEEMVSYLSNEGCMEILELSYRHLPNNLKPCLLYLGAFREDKLIRVKQVIMLWIAEGFIQQSKTKSIEDVAKEYLYGLVARSFIIVSARSSDGELKMFRVHDLIHEFCRTKCRDMNFFQLDHGITSSSSSNPSINNYYRISMQKQSNVTIDAGSTLSNARSLFLFGEKYYDVLCEFPLKKFRLAQVLHLCLILGESDKKQLSSVTHSRHIYVHLLGKREISTGKCVPISIPSSISNLWNLGSLVLTSLGGEIHLPKTFWAMRSLRHVKVDWCKLKFLDGHEAYPKLDNVVSFSKPILITGKDVQQLMQRLPAVRKLSCTLQDFLNNGEESEETLDFYRKLESLTLTLSSNQYHSRSYLINFPATLKKLTLEWFYLPPWTNISTIAELYCLEVLKLRRISFPSDRLEMEDVTFQNLKFFELCADDLVQWTASTESLPCLEQLMIFCRKLKGLPPCFEEISTLKRIVVEYSYQVESSALRIQEEQKEHGNEVEVVIHNR